MREIEPLNCICFVILHYGDPGVTDKCVRSIKKLDRKDRIQIVIVDNDDRLARRGRPSFSLRYSSGLNVTVLRAGEGSGFSRANNLGYAYAREKLNADCVIICNNDIEFVQRDFICRLERSVSMMQCHVLGPCVIRRSCGEPQNPMDTRLRTENEARYTIRMNRLALKILPAAYPLLRISQIHQDRGRIRKKRAEKAYYKTQHKHIIPFGACLIFTPGFVRNEEKAFDPETQFYYEEYILACRCFRKGYETGYDPSMKVLHESGNATKQNAGSRYRQMKRLLEHTASACSVYIDMLAGVQDHGSSD